MYLEPNFLPQAALLLLDTPLATDVSSFWAQHFHSSSSFTAKSRSKNITRLVIRRCCLLGGGISIAI